MSTVDEKVKVIIFWEEVPEDSNIYLVDISPRTADALLEASGSYINFSEDCLVANLIGSGNNSDQGFLDELEESRKEANLPEELLGLLGRFEPQKGLALPPGTEVYGAVKMGWIL